MFLYNKLFPLFTHISEFIGLSPTNSVELHLNFLTNSGSEILDGPIDTAIITIDLIFGSFITASFNFIWTK